MASKLYIDPFDTTVTFPHVNTEMAFTPNAESTRIVNTEMAFTPNAESTRIASDQEIDCAINE